MAGFVYYSEELLKPISDEHPCGQDLRYDPLFSEILDARRADDALSSGEWEKQEGRKSANWKKVADLCLNALTTRTKDLRLVCFLTEAALNLDGFQGLQDCLRLCRELMVSYWEGIYPAIEEGDLDYRASGLRWINDPMPDVVRLLPITARQGENYNFVRYLQAKRLGSEAGIAAASGDRRETLDGLRKQGWITMDAFDAAVKGTKRAAFESLYAPFDQAEKELAALARASDEKFGDDGPSFTTAREAFAEMKIVLDPILRKKREEEPDAVPGGETLADQPAAGAVAANGQGGLQSWTAGLPADQMQSWSEAEAMVRGGNVDRGLAQMAALAASESSGRARFLRKLMLVDVCLSVNRERLARTILEELKEQIATYHLDQWESSAIVGGVWSRLYRLYRKSEQSNELEQSIALYAQLCKLDPWQAYLHCED